MTISSNAAPKAGPFNGNGVQTVFPFTFHAFSKNDLLVVSAIPITGIQTTLVVDSDYSVTLNADQSANPGGSITYPISGSPLPVGSTLTIVSDIDYTQITDLVNMGGFYPDVIEDSLDRGVMQGKQILEIVSRTLQVAVSTPLDVSVTLPAPSALQLIGWNSTATGLVNYVPDVSSAAGLQVRLADTSNLSNGDALIGVKRTATGAVATTLHNWVEGKVLNVVSDFGAVPGGVVDCSAAFTAMWATGLQWEIPDGDFLISVPQTITNSGICRGRLIAKTGFTGRLITICNTVYNRRLSIWGLDVYSTDVRPNPYTAAANTGIYIGPDASNIGVNSTPNVALYSCRSTRFSYGCHIATYNVDCYSCNFFQNDHNGWIYSTDTVHNQVNDVHFYGCSMDSAATSFGAIAYALRIGTSGNGTYASSIGMGYNLKFIGCNFDAAPVYVDNVIGIDIRSYFEQPSGYTYHGGAIVLGSAGSNTLQDVNISQCTFTLFDYAVEEKNSVLGLTVGPNNCSAIKYRELLAVACESFGFKYISGTAIGSFNSNGDPVCTNFSSGIAVSQLTFGGISIDRDFLIGGSQLAPMQTSSTSWYPRGMTNDGSFNGTNGGRNRTGSAIQTGIAGTQAGQVFTFTNPAQAALFNGGDSLNGLGAGGASRIYSVNYLAGTCVLNNVFAGATTLTHDPAYFIGYNLFGNGSPAGVVAANPGSRYINFAGGAGTTTYVKESGTGTAGWVGK